MIHFATHTLCNVLVLGKAVLNKPDDMGSTVNLFKLGRCWETYHTYLFF